MTRTLAMIKPGAREHTEEILQIVGAEFLIIGQKVLQLTPLLAQEFYAEHQGQPFFEGLWQYMTSGPVTIMALEHPDAVKAWRKLLGATNPSDAAPETIRYLFGRGNKLPNNVAHGSDSEAAAERELAFFFAGYELIRS